MSNKPEPYFVPADSHWPIVGAIGLFFIAVGAGLSIQSMEQGGIGHIISLLILAAGFCIVLIMFAGWMSNVITESLSGLYSQQLSRSFRQGMSWFIFSEVMFFGALFGALFYARMISVPWLGGAGNNAMTHEVLWPMFDAIWPLTTTPDGTTTQEMPWTGIPLKNTILLLASSVTLHFAHTCLEKNKRTALIVWLELTIVLAGFFMYFQAVEYYHAYNDLNLTLSSGVYGNTFFLLTGFHGMHVLLGTVFLLVLLARLIFDHFSATEHFAFQAGSWYWHFVDVVWLCLFIFVYIL